MTVAMELQQQIEALQEHCHELEDELAERKAQTCATCDKADECSIWWKAGDFKASEFFCALWTAKT